MRTATKYILTCVCKRCVFNPSLKFYLFLYRLALSSAAALPPVYLTGKNLSKIKLENKFYKDELNK